MFSREPRKHHPLPTRDRSRAKIWLLVYWKRLPGGLPRVRISPPSIRILFRPFPSFSKKFPRT